MSRHIEFYADLFIHTKHSENAQRLKPGIKLNPKNKLEFCLDMRRLVKNGRLIPTEKMTFNELMAFGVNKRGTYSSQIGHDDIAMTMVNVSTFFKSEQFYELVGNVYDNLDEKYKTAIMNRMNLGDSNSDDDKMDMSFLRGLMD